MILRFGLVIEGMTSKTNLKSDYSDEEILNNNEEQILKEEEDNNEENWLGSSDEEGEKELSKREKALKAHEDEFIEEIRDNSAIKGFVDLNAPSIDFEEVKNRATLIVSTLQDLKNLGEEGLTRQDYLNKLYDDLTLLYGYNRFLLEEIASLVPVSELIDFIEANEHQRPVVIRTNTLRTRRKELERVLNDRGIRLGPVGKWSKLGLIVFDSQVPLGATPEYLSGHYMLQSPSSFLPVMALNPQPNTRVLDMCAAPGGKTTHMAQLMKNTGAIIANDVNSDRCQSLIANIHRLGVVNTIVVNYDGRAFPTVMGGFDSVLLDAPCTGTGVISRDQSVKSCKSDADIKVLTKNQKELILHAYDSITSSGGKLCYCTCSVLVEENEAVVDYLLNHRKCKVIPSGLEEEFDSELTPGIINYKGHHFHPSIKLTRRVYPHRMNMDGFYFALIDVPPGQRGEIIEKDEKEKIIEKKNNNKIENNYKKKKFLNKKKKEHTKKFSKRFGGK